MVISAPNNSKVTAKVGKVTRGPANKSTVELTILESSDVGGMPNFTRDRVNQRIVASTAEDVSGLKAGDEVSADVRFAGDERGGRFFTSNLKRKK